MLTGVMCVGKCNQSFGPELYPDDPNTGYTELRIQSTVLSLITDAEIYNFHWHVRP